MHSHLLETGEQSGPSGLLVSAGHRVFNGFLLLFCIGDECTVKEWEYCAIIVCLPPLFLIGLSLS